MLTNGFEVKYKLAALPKKVLFNKIRQEFFQVVGVLLLLVHLDSNEMIGEKAR